MRTTYLCLALYTVACDVDRLPDENLVGEREVRVEARATLIPVTGECTRITATRLSDFQVSTFIGPLDGAVLLARPGEHRVTAVAFPQPCNAEPASPPWVADVQTVTFTPGRTNILLLTFRSAAEVFIVPEFESDAILDLRPGSRVQLGRNGEDISGPGFAIDGWQVKKLQLPPPGGGGAPAETTLFSVRGFGMPRTPRGLATPPDGSFVFDVGEATRPLWAFDGAGALQATWPVFYSPGQVIWDFTDGIEAIDATRFVRTGSLREPRCESGSCVQAGLDILERRKDLFGFTTIAVVDQIFVPEAFGVPRGVAAVNGRFAVTTRATPATDQLVLLEADGTVVAGPREVTASLEGLLATDDGRLVAMDYTGRLATFDADDLDPRPGEELSYAIAPDLSLPTSLAWHQPSAQYVVLDGIAPALSFATPGFESSTPIPIDLSSYSQVAAIDVRVEADQLLLIDRVPPLDAASGELRPAIDVYDLGLFGLVSRIALQGISLPAQPRSIAYIPFRGQVVSHHRRPAGSPDDGLAATAFVNSFASGALAYTIDLGPIGFTRIDAVSYRQFTDELLFVALDSSGIRRILVTDVRGNPRRSYRLDGLASVPDLPGLVDLAEVTSGPFVGDVTAVIDQPSEAARLFIQ